MVEKTKPIRLVVLASTYPRWQGDHEPGFVHELSKRLANDFEVIAIVPHALGARRSEILEGVRVVRYVYAPERWETLVNGGGIVTNLRAFPMKWLLVPSFFIMQWLVARRLRGPDSIVHAHWILLPGLVARLLGRPYLVTSHGADLFSLRGRLAVGLKRIALRRASEMSVVSSAMLTEGARLRNGDVPIVAPMGVDLQGMFVPPQADRDTDHLIFVGRLVEKKGLQTLLEAMPGILAYRPGVVLSIIGHGPLRPALEQLAERLGLVNSVRFVGGMSSSELVAWYQRASVFVAPFRQASNGDEEGLGLVLIEALGCGCPVVTTDVAAISDVVTGLNGIRRVPMNSPSQLSQAIIAALQDPEAVRDVLSSRAILVERFDWCSVAKRYAELLKTFVAKEQ